MPRPVSRPTLGTAVRCSLAAILAGALACMNDAPLASADATAGIRFSANVVSAAGRTIEIAVMYRRSSGGTVRVPATPERISLEPGATVDQAVTVDLSGCLRDGNRVPADTPGCGLVVELTLLDEAGNMVDRQAKEAPGAPTGPGQVVELGSVTIGVQVGSVTVEPTSVRLAVTQDQQLAATVKDASGASLTNMTVTWVSTDASVARLSATTGSSVTVTALKLGSASLTASSGGKTSPPIPVTVVALDPLTISPASASVEAGATLQLTVIDPPGAVAWQTSDQTVATVDQNGLVHGVQARENSPVTITATSGSGATQRAGTARITVTSAPPLVIDQRPASGCVIVGQTVTLVVASPPGAVSWSSETPSIATIDASSGVARGVSAGQATITARSANRSGTAPVCVVGPLSDVPPTLAITAGQTAQLSPSGTSGATVAYTSDKANIATVSGSGLITGVGVGEARITTTLTAASGSQEATTVVTVSAASITVAPNPASVAVGGQQALTATARDANGVGVEGVEFSWTVDDPTTVQLVGTSGNPIQVRGLKLGATSVRVAGGGASGAVQVTVTPAAPASITVTLTAPALTIGQTTTATAEVKDAAGNVLTDQTVSWTSSLPQVASVASTGARTATVTAAGAGSADITAAIGAVSGKATITVGDVPVATLTLTPPSASITVAGTQVLTAVPRDLQGNALVGRTVTWQVTGGDASVVQLSTASSISTASGATMTVTGAKVGGPLTITAVSGGQTATSQITVTPGAPASIALTPTSVSLAVGQTSTLTAVVKDTQGNTITSLPSGLAISWAPSSPSVASTTPSEGQPFQATVLALTPGTTLVAATISLSGSTLVSNSVTVTVNPPPLVIAADSPNNPTCAVSSFDCQFAVKVTNSLGEPVEGAEVRWSTNVGCNESFTLTTNAQGRSTTANTCSHNVLGAYTQTAALVGTDQSVTFDFQFVGFGLEVHPLANSTGSGQVTSTGGNGAVNCTITAGTDAAGICATAFGPNMIITLTASPTGGSVFAGWGGSTCAEGGTTQPLCTVTMSQARTLTVTFAPAWETATLISTSSPAPGVTTLTYRVPSRGGVINGISFEGIEYPPEQLYKNFISNVQITGGTSTPTTVTFDDCTCGRPPGSSWQFYLVFTTTTPGVELNPVWYVFSSSIPAGTSAPRSSGDAAGLTEPGRPITGPTSVPSTPLLPSGSTSRPPSLDADAVSLQRPLANPSPRAIVNPELLRNGRTGTRP